MLAAVILDACSRKVVGYGLGPVAVTPAQQRRGIGSTLVPSALQRLSDAGVAGCAVLGDPSNCGRFGFAPRPGFVYPGPPLDHFMVPVLAGAAPVGTDWTHRSAPPTVAASSGKDRDMTAMTAHEAQATARIAGFGYLTIFVLAILANFFVLEPLGVRGDAASTAANIASSGSVYRAGVAAFVIVLIADLVVGWALFVTLRPAGAHLSVLMLMFRAAYTIAHVGVVLGLLSALSFAKAPAWADALGAGSKVMAYHFLAGHGLGFTVTLIFFGVHLLLLGALIARAPYMPTAIGWLVGAAGMAYITDGFGTILLGSYGAYAGAASALVIITALAGEGALMGWLMVRGVNKLRYPEGSARLSI